MKLRLNGNSLRLRLSQADVARLADRGRVEETVEFAGLPLIYSIESVGTSALAATFESNCIRVTIPAADASRWIASDQTGIENRNTSPRILVEKD
ncbi:MAG TPA: hypothetical protein VKS01_06515, partial [Bryobacteraceae bacterium]|nr:hypothetical protein [Bryobacteraceae bacterium]